jgi:hypothetical protein
LGTKYLVVLCAGSTLPLAKQSSDKAPYKLSGAVAKLAGITFSRLALSYWIDNLGFITEGELAAIFIKSSLGVSNWPVIYYTFPRQLGNRSFLSLLPRLKKKLPHRNHRAINKFSGVVDGEKKTSARGVSHAHPLLCFKFCFTLFLLGLFYQKHKKISIFCSCFYLSAFSLLEWLLLKTPSCVTLLA